MLKKLLLVIALLGISLTAAAQVTITDLGVTGQTGTSATIAWTTSGPATSQLIFGLNPAQLTSNTVQDDNLVTSHQQSITGIFNNSIFYYAAVSIDNVGHVTTSPTQSFELCSNNGGSTPGYTQVAGTVNNYYEYGNYSIAWTNQSGQAITPTVCGVPISTTFTGALSPQGTLSVSLPDNLQVVPSPSQWTITINSVGGIGVYVNAPQTISGPSVNLNSLLGPNAVGFTSHCFIDQSTGTVYPPGCGGGGGGGGTINGTLNFVAKFTPNGTSVGNSEGFSDGTSPVQWPLGVSLQLNALFTVKTNNTTTGTAANLLVARDDAGNAITAQPTDTNNLIGIAGFGAGLSGSVSIAYSGQFPCIFDNQTAIKDWVILGSGGQCHDAGAVEPTGVQNIGRVDTVNGGTGTLAIIDMGLPDVVNNAGGGTGVVGNCNTSGAMAYYPAIGMTIGCDPAFTTNGAGTFTAVGGIFTGPSAGFVAFGQGSQPSLIANSVNVFAPTSVPTAYGIVLPAADASGCLQGTDSAGIVTLTFTGASCGSGSGSVSSVAQTSPAGVLSQTGGPITTSGTFVWSWSGTSGGVPYFSSNTTMASSALLALDQLVLGGGVGNAPFTLGSLGTTTTVLHGNAAGIPSFGPVIGGDMTNNTVTSTQLAVVNTRRVCSMTFGADNGTALVDADLGPQREICQVPYGATIYEIDVTANAGTPNIIPGLRHCTANPCASNFTVSNLVSSALATAASGGPGCSKTGATAGLDTFTTCAATLQNTAVAVGDYIEAVSGTAGGTASRVSVDVHFTVN